HGAEGDPRRGDGRIPAGAAHRRVGVEHAAALEGEPLEAIEVAGRMYALECLSGCRSRLAPLDGGRHVGRTQRLEHRDDALGAPEAEARIEEQQRVERQKAGGERRERPAERPHRTGWRRAGRTMNGELGTAPSAASVVDSSSTCAPLNFTTWSCKGILRRFNAWVRAARFKSAIVVVGATVSDTWSQTSVTMTRTGNCAPTTVTRPRPRPRAAASRGTGRPPDRRTRSTPAPASCRPHQSAR